MCDNLIKTKKQEKYYTETYNTQNNKYDTVV